MKRWIFVVGIAFLSAAALVAQTYRDGFYFAQDASFTSNQRNQVVIEVRGGRIASANWNLLSLNAGARDLKAIAATGTPAGAVTWAGQAGTVEQFLVSSQNVNATSVPGVPANFNVAPFFDLVRRALANPAVARGIYSKDGWFYAEAATVDEYRTRNTVLITIVNGTIVDVLWNGILVGMPPNINPSKMITSRNNQYPMTGARSRWDVQAEATALALVQAQDPDRLRVRADGTADGISGVTMLINTYITVVKQALAAAR